MVVVQQEFLPAAVLVAASESPDRGPVTVHAGSDGVDRLAGGDGQHDARVLDLEPSHVPGASDSLQDGQIRGSDGQGASFAATHGGASDGERV
jgi:hypothetical protein